jgi:hypothetical protein
MKGSSLTRKLILQNSGDLDATFKWETKGLAPDFSVVPVRGTVKAGADIEISVIFTPTRDVADVQRDDVLCFVTGEISPSEKAAVRPMTAVVKGSKSKTAAVSQTDVDTQTEGSIKLKASFSGTCILQKPVGESLSFSCPVREKIIKEATFTLPPFIQSNRKPGSSLILPVRVGGEYFSAPSTVDV